MGRLGEPEDIAEAAAFLCSDSCVLDHRADTGGRRRRARHTGRLNHDSVVIAAGLRLARTHANGWTRRCPGLREGALVAQPASGGFSNLTYRLSDGVSDWVVRRPPLGHVLPSAHDMAREYRIISALAPTDVPVATPLAFCADEDVIGARFYLMSYVEGQVVDEHDLPAIDDDRGTLTGSTTGWSTRSSSFTKSIQTQVGLGDLGRPQGIPQSARSTAGAPSGRLRKRGRWPTSTSRLIFCSRDSPTARSRQSCMATTASGTSSSHRERNAVAAVVDWEMATLGDPLADLGLLVAYHRASHR